MEPKTSRQFIGDDANETPLTVAAQVMRAAAIQLEVQFLHCMDH